MPNAAACGERDRERDIAGWREQKTLLAEAKRASRERSEHRMRSQSGGNRGAGVARGVGHGRREPPNVTRVAPPREERAAAVRTFGVGTNVSRGQSLDFTDVQAYEGCRI